MTRVESDLIKSIQGTQDNKRPSVITLAKNVLQEKLRIDSASGTYHLFDNGRWSAPVTLGEVMRTANRVLRARGDRQITTNPSWEVRA